MTTGGLALSSASITIAIKAVTTTSRYNHAGHSDTSQWTTTPTGTITSWTIPLPGNVTYTYSSFAGYTFTFYNEHGDAIAISDANGDRLWEGRAGPYGETIIATPDNTNIAGTTLGWHGKDERITDRGGIIHMGARPYSTTHRRFLAVDPIEGGCANNYAYVYGDPINRGDVSGRGFWDELWSDAKCFYNNNKGAIAVGLGGLALLTSGGSSLALPFLLGVGSVGVSIDLFGDAVRSRDAAAGASASFGLSTSVASWFGGASQAARAFGKGTLVLGGGLVIWDSRTNPSSNDCY